MMRSWSNHMLQAAPVQGWAVIPCGRTPNLILLQHTNAQNALRIGPPNGIPPRRGCASVERWCCQSRRRSTWWTWTTPAATGCSSWLGMASHGCEMGSPRRMQRLPAAMSHPNRTRISNWGMRWILECWQKPHCAQLTMPRPACRISCRARTGCNFALRYSTESLTLRPSHPKLRPGLRSPRTARRNRLLWYSTRMLLQPWPWPASWLGQMSRQKKPCKAVVPAKEVILALEQGAAAGGADPRRKGQIAREAIDAFILGMVRFQVGSSARFNDLQHTSPSTMKVTSNTIEMMAWQTKTASAFRIKKNPVPLIAPKLSLSGVDWWRLYSHLWNVSRTWTTWSQPWARTSRVWYPDPRAGTSSLDAAGSSASSSRGSTE